MREQATARRPLLRQTETRVLNTVAAGLHDSPEGKGHGFTHMFCLTFDGESVRDAYLPHPAHVAYQLQ